MYSLTLFSTGEVTWDITPIYPGIRFSGRGCRLRNKRLIRHHRGRPATIPSDTVGATRPTSTFCIATGFVRQHQTHCSAHYGHHRRDGQFGHLVPALSLWLRSIQQELTRNFYSPGSQAGHAASALEGAYAAPPARYLLNHRATNSCVASRPLAGDRSDIGVADGTVDHLIAHLNANRPERRDHRNVELQLAAVRR